MNRKGFGGALSAESRVLSRLMACTSFHTSGEMMASCKAHVQQSYCRDISIKTRTSLDIKRRNGDFVGVFPVYGYMKSEENKNLLVPDPYASRVVQAIFRMRLDGTSALRIATVLNEMGILSPPGL